MPDVHLHVGHRSTAILAVVNVDAQGERDAALDVAAVKVRADVTAIKSGSTVVDEVGAFLALGSYRARGIRRSRCSSG